MSAPLLIDTAAVSELTGIPSETLRQWRRLGRGPQSAKIGRRWVYRPADVREWIDGHFPTCALCRDEVPDDRYCAECGRTGPEFAVGSATGTDG